MDAGGGVGARSAKMRWLAMSALGAMALCVLLAHGQAPIVPLPEPARPSSLPDLPLMPVPQLPKVDFPEKSKPPELPLPTPPEVRVALQPIRPLDSNGPSDLPNIEPVVPKLTPELLLPDGSNIVLPEQTKQLIRFGPRYGKLNDYQIEPLEGDIQRITYTGGLIVNVVYLPEKVGDPPQEVEFATDNAVIWIKGMKQGPNLFGGLQTDRASEKPKEGEPAKDDKTKIEFYMSGNVVFRTRSGGSGPTGPTTQTLRTEELYYDVDKNRAIAIKADLETTFQQGFDPVHVRGQEIWRLGPHEWKAFEVLTFSSKLPNDPAVTISSRDATLTEELKVKKNIFGRPFRDLLTGKVDVSYERLLTANKNRVRVKEVPLLFFPKYQTDISDPSGPLNSFGFRQDIIFGMQGFTNWNVYKLLGYRPPPGHSWSVNLDYLSLRGPAIGTDYVYKDLFGLGTKNSGSFSAYGVYDNLRRDLIAFRGIEPINPYYRGRVSWLHNQDIYEFGTDYMRYMGQLAYQSDKNFYEQYFKLRFDTDMNQETFAYLYGARGITSASLLGQANINRQWVTETQWLPRVDGAVVGLSILDRFVYTARGSAGYAMLRAPSQSPLSVIPTESSLDTFRGNVNQKISAPIDLGPVRLEPYGIVDLSVYSRDLTGESRGRATGAGGAKASIPFSKIYRDVENELFNVRGLNHKMNFTANYYYAKSNTPLSQLPLLDRVYDDATDLNNRSFRSTAILYGLFLPDLINAAAAPAFANDPVYDAQLYAKRRVATNRPETIDTLQVVQFDAHQRLQTKRGPVGNEHTVDWMTLDVSASLFPDPERDNFGKAGFSFLEGNYQWNVGDRFTLLTSAWVDPFEFGARYLSMGLNFYRPDGTSLYLGYRHIDPLGSRAFIASLVYQINRKYSTQINGVFDFGFQKTFFTSVAFNRTGTDLTMSLGFTYNALINNLGLQFLLIPNSAVQGSTIATRPIAAQPFP